MTPERFVITGGPGSGKSTLLDRLAACGFTRMEEAGRAIIRDQTAIGGRALPWADIDLFAELMLGWDLRSYHMAGAAPGPVLYDRGVPDTLGFLRLEGRPVPEHVATAARTYRYAPRVFLTPPWPEIYATDTERRQSPEVAARTYDAMAAVYAGLGYELVVVPRADPDERCAFVREKIAELSGGRCGPR